MGGAPLSSWRGPSIPTGGAPLSFGGVPLSLGGVPLSLGGAPLSFSRKVQRGPTSWHGGSPTRLGGAPPRSENKVLHDKMHDYSCMIHDHAK